MLIAIIDLREIDNRFFPFAAICNPRKMSFPLIDSPINPYAQYFNLQGSGNHSEMLSGLRPARTPAMMPKITQVRPRKNDKSKA